MVENKPGQNLLRCEYLQTIRISQEGHANVTLTILACQSVT